MACTVKIIFFALLLGYTWSASSTAKDNVGEILAGQASYMLVNTPWDSYLIAAPLAVSLLGQLNLVSVREGVPDFPLHHASSNFTYIKHPDSFRASLAQLGTDGAYAFTVAKENMLKIRSNMAGIPRSYQRVIKTAKRTKVEKLKKSVTRGIQRVVNLSQKCIEFAQAVNTAFGSVQNLMAELLQGTTGAGGDIQKQLKQAETQLKISRNNEKMLKQQVELIEKRRNATDENLKKLREVYISAVKSIPSSWEVLGQELLKSVVDGTMQIASTAVNYAMMARGGAAVAAADAVGSAVAGGGDGDASATTASPAATGSAGANVEKASEDNQNNEQVIIAYKKCAEQFDIMHTLAELLFKNNTTPVTESPNNLIRKSKAALGIYVDMIEKLANIEEKSRALTLIKGGQDILDEMDKLTETLTDINKLQTGHEDKITKLSTLVGNLHRLALSSKSNSNAAAAPDVPVLDAKEYEGPGGREKFKATMAQQDVARAEAESMKLLDRQVELTNQMMEASNLLIDLSAKQIDFKKIAELIVEAINIIRQIQGAWQNLIYFFQDITNSVRVFNEVYVQQTMGEVIDTIEQDDDDSVDREEIIDILEDNQRDFVRETTAMSTIANTYEIVAEKYIVKAMYGIGKLLTVSDPTQQGIEQKKLREQTAEDIKNIQVLVKNTISTARDKLRAEGYALEALSGGQVANEESDE